MSDVMLSIRPGVSSGAPCIGRTGVPIGALAGCIWAGDSLESTANDYDVTRDEALVGCWFLATYGIEAAWWNGRKRHAPGRVWVKRWGSWASDYAEQFWRHQYDAIPDPPDINGYLDGVHTALGDLTHAALRAAMEAKG